MLPNIHHELFAQAVAEVKNATDSIHRRRLQARGNSAGNAASRLWEYDGVKRRPKEIVAELASKAIADAGEIQRLPTSVMRGAVNEQLLTRQGDVVSVQAHVRGRTNAAK